MVTDGSVLESEFVADLGRGWYAVVTAGEEWDGSRQRSQWRLACCGGRGRRQRATGRSLWQWCLRDGNDGARRKSLK